MDPSSRFSSGYSSFQGHPENLEASSENLRTPVENLAVSTDSLGSAPLKKLKRKEIVDQMALASIHLSELYTQAKAPFNLSESRFHSKDGKNYENAVLFNYFIQTGIIIKEYEEKLTTSLQKKKEKAAAMRWEEEAPPTMVQLRDWLIEERRAEKIKAIEAQKTKEDEAYEEEKLKDWSVSSPVYIEEVKKSHQEIDDAIILLQRELQSLEIEANKFEAKLSETKEGNLQGFNAGWELVEEKIELTTVLFFKMHMQVKEALKKALEEDILPIQKIFHSNVEDEWDSICVSMLTLIARQQHINIQKVTLPIIRQLCADVAVQRDAALTEKRKFESIIAKEGRRTVPGMGTLYLDENHKALKEMELYANTNLIEFKKLDRRIQNFTNVYGKIALNEKSIVQTFKPLNDMFDRLKIRSNHVRYFAKESNYIMLEDVINKFERKRKDLWNKITNEFTQACSTHLDHAYQLNQMRDCSKNRYISPKTLYDNEAFVTKLTGFLSEDTERDFMPTVIINKNDPYAEYKMQLVTAFSNPSK